MYRILAAEDDQDAASVLQLVLGNNGFDYDIAYNGNDAMDLINTYPYDVYLLDIMMPGLDGLEVLTRLRAIYAKAPVIITSALDQPSDITKGFDLRTDDYLTKPFHPNELVERIYCQIRRSLGASTNLFELAPGLYFNIKEATLTYCKDEVHMSPNETKLFFFLLKNKHTNISRELIMDYMYNNTDSASIDSVNKYISLLRNLLKNNTDERAVINSPKGQGVRISFL